MVKSWILVSVSVVCLLTKMHKQSWKQGLTLRTLPILWSALRTRQEIKGPSYVPMDVCPLSCLNFAFSLHNGIISTVVIFPTKAWD